MNDEIKREVTRTVKDEFDRYAAAMGQRGCYVAVPQVTVSVVNNVFAALASLIEVSAQTCAGWLAGDGWPIEELLVCRSQIVHLPSVIGGKAEFAMAHTPRLFVTNKLDVDYKTDAKAPARWNRFLDEVFDNDLDSRLLLQQFFGYCLTPDTSHQKFLMLVGKSRGGKGTIMRLLGELVGKPNYCAIRLGKLATRFGLEDALGKSLILVPDANMPRPERAAEVAELVKAIVGGDALDIDRKGRPVVTAPLPAKVVVASNNMIALPDDSAALYNRMLVIRFVQSFKGREDKTLDATLRSELEGVLHWAIDGYRQLREQDGFTEPQSGEEIKVRLREFGSPISTFVEECCVVSDVVGIDKKELFDAWKGWCHERGLASGELSAFSQLLFNAVPSVRDTRPRKGDSRTRRYQGISLANHSVDRIRADSFESNRTIPAIPFDANCRLAPLERETRSDFERFAPSDN